MFGNFPSPTLAVPVSVCVPVPLMVMVAVPVPVVEEFVIVIFPFALIAPVFMVSEAAPLMVSVLFTVKVVPDAIVFTAVEDGANSSAYNVIDPVMVLVAENNSLPLLCANDPLVNVKLALIEKVALVDVNVVPAIVKAPAVDIAAEPPRNTPPVRLPPVEPSVMV